MKEKKYYKIQELYQNIFEKYSNLTSTHKPFCHLFLASRMLEILKIEGKLDEENYEEYKSQLATEFGLARMDLHPNARELFNFFADSLAGNEVDLSKYPIAQDFLRNIIQEGQLDSVLNAFLSRNNLYLQGEEGKTEDLFFNSF